MRAPGLCHGIHRLHIRPRRKFEQAFHGFLQGHVMCRPDILGLSMAGWNVLWSICLVIFGALAAKSAGQENK